MHSKNIETATYSLIKVWQKVVSKVGSVEGSCQTLFQTLTVRCSRCPCDCVPHGPAGICPTTAEFRIWAVHIFAWSRWTAKGSCSGSPTAAPAPPVRLPWAVYSIWCDRAEVAASLGLPRPRGLSARHGPCTSRVC